MKALKWHCKSQALPQRNALTFVLALQIVCKNCVLHWHSLHIDFVWNYRNNKHSRQLCVVWAWFGVAMAVVSMLIAHKVTQVTRMFITWNVYTRHTFDFRALDPTASQSTQLVSTSWIYSPWTHFNLKKILLGIPPKKNCGKNFRARKFCTHFLFLAPISGVNKAIHHTTNNLRLMHRVWNWISCGKIQSSTLQGSGDVT